MVVPAGNVALGASLLDSLGLGDLLLVVDTDIHRNVLEANEAKARKDR